MKYEEALRSLEQQESPAPVGIHKFEVAPWEVAVFVGICLALVLFAFYDWLEHERDDR